MKKSVIAAERLFIITILVTSLFCPGLYAADQILPTPEEIIAKNTEALGGKEAHKKIYNKLIVISIKHIPMNINEKFTEYLERPDKYYISSETATGTKRYGSNGKIAWAIDPHSGARLLGDFELSIFRLSTKFDPPDVPYKSIKTEGIDKINGKDCYKVVKTTENGSEKIAYYDKKSFMIVKTIDYYKIPQMGNKKVETYNEDYKKINGILFPFRVVSFLNDKKEEEKTYETIELNIEMPERIFDIPEEVKAIMNKKETEQHAQQ